MPWGCCWYTQHTAVECCRAESPNITRCSCSSMAGTLFVQTTTPHFCPFYTARAVRDEHKPSVHDGMLWNPQNFCINLTCLFQARNTFLWVTPFHCYGLRRSVKCSAWRTGMPHLCLTHTHTLSPRDLKVSTLLVCCDDWQLSSDADWG